MKLYKSYLAMQVKSLAQYRLSLLLSSISQFLVTFLAFFSVLFTFRHFGALEGWSYAEVMMCFAVTNTAMALSECFARGFDVFRSYVRDGSFDRILLRPRSHILQILGSKMDFSRVGRLVQSLAALVYAVLLIGGWTPAKALCLGLMLVCGVCVFTGLLIFGATMCFWTVEALEVVNILIYGGQDLSSYPLAIYGKWFRRFFTFLVPFACFNYLPLMYITGKTEHPATLLIPVAGCFFLVPCLLFWRFGVRHYLSTGS